MTLGPFMEEGGQQQTRNPHLKMHIGSARCIKPNAAPHRPYLTGLC